MIRRQRVAREKRFMRATRDAMWLLQTATVVPLVLRLTVTSDCGCWHVRRALSPDVLDSAEPGMGRRADVIARTSATSMVQRSDMDEPFAAVCVSEANLVRRFLSVN